MSTPSSGAVDRAIMLADLLIEALIDIRVRPNHAAKLSRDIDAESVKVEQFSALQRRVLNVLKEANSRPLRAAEIAKRTTSTEAAVKKAIQRLTEAGAIKLRASKRGPQGWTSFDVLEGFNQ